METAKSSKAIRITRELDGQIALLHLCRPPANAYDRAVLDELNACIDEVRWDEGIIGAVIASDLPNFFSAGADMRSEKHNNPTKRAVTVLHAHEIFRKIENTPKIFVAAIGGHALGGGLEIALACDFRLAAEGDYYLGFPEVTLGMLPGNGGTQRLTRLIGRSKALELLTRGNRVGPEIAHDLSLVDYLVPAERLIDEALEYVSKVSGGPLQAVGTIKVVTKLGADLPLEGGLALEREAAYRLLMSEDAQEGLAAFLEKRNPRWSRR